ncbi:hypothetical protein T492DRAFT_892780, partial [Pavlovales sp. CCMP2436]
MVDAVFAVGTKSNRLPERMEPQPRLCRSAAEVRACHGVKPCRSNSLSLLEQVQALNAVEHKLGLETLYVLGTNCADN